MYYVFNRKIEKYLDSDGSWSNSDVIGFSDLFGLARALFLLRPDITDDDVEITTGLSEGVG